MSKRVGVYTRISDDKEGESLGVARQEKDCRAIARERGWEVAEVYTDNSISAYKRRVVRPEFERLLSDLAEGRIDGVVVYDVDRFARQPRDLERAIDILEERRPAPVYASAQGDIELSRADGRLQARMMVAFANKSSADTSRRVTRKALELAERGIPTGGTRPFGWRADKRTLDPGEAGILRDAIEQVLAGQSLGKVTDDLNARGVLTSPGGRWSRQTLRQLLLSPRLCGWRTYRGEILRVADGTPVVGQWQPLLTPDQWEQLRDTIAPPTRTKSERPGGRRYLLSGVIRCGACGGKMRGNGKGEVRRHSWQCPPTSMGGCGKTGISGQADDIIERLVLERLAEVKVQPVAQEFVGAEKLADLQQRRADLMSAFTSGDLSADVTFPAVKVVEQRIDRLRGEERAHKAKQRRPVAVAAPESWPDLNVHQRRAVVETLIDSVVVGPARHGGGRFDVKRLSVVWA